MGRFDSSSEPSLRSRSPEPREAHEVGSIMEASGARAESPDCEEESAAREVWGFGDLGGNLGMARDVVGLGRQGTVVGFKIAGAATRFGFGIARGTLRGIGSVGDFCRVPGLGKVMQATDAVVGGAQQITEGSQAMAKGIALGSMDVTIGGLDAAGAEKHALAKRVIGANEVDACVSVAGIAARLNHNAGFETLSGPDLAVGFARYSTVQPDPITRGPEVDIAPLTRWMWLCAATYGQRWCHAMGMFRNIQVPADDFLASAAAERGCVLLLDRTRTPSLELYQRACAVFADDAASALVVAIRGTGSMRDLLTDLVCEPAPLQPGELQVGEVDAQFVHDGMWRSAQRLVDELQGTVQAALEERPTHRVIVTGHSLGAGVAALLCLLWKPLLGDRVTSVAFASPQTLDAAAARAAEGQGVTSLLLGDDLVPRLSLRSATDLGAAAVRLGGEEGASEALVEAARRQPSAGPPAMAPEAPTAEEVPRSTPALRPAGRLVHLRGGTPAVQACVADVEDFAAIRVSRSMLISHMPSSYLRALGEL